MIKPVLLAAGLALALVAAAHAQAPQPAKPIDPERFYQGRWLEIGRRPMGITRNCVAGSTDYTRRSDSEVAVVDACRRDTPEGKEVVIKGRGEILDPGQSAKLRVRYPFFITWDYWVLDRADDYSWFISADPKFKNLFIYTRAFPTPEEKAALVERARALGYDVDKLEFPPGPPR